MDGDGLDDILVGANYNDESASNAGKAYVILAGSLGSTGPIDLALADHSFVGESSSDFAGLSVSGAGDVDGDGLGDILVGAPYNGDGGIYGGKTYLILGDSLATTATISLALADHSFVGENANDFSGTSVSNAGDVDGDGLDDVLVGAWGNDDGGAKAGKAYIIVGASLGGASTIDLSIADHNFVGEGIASDLAGHSVSDAGDVDGDGLDDILVGAYDTWPAGKAYLILGARLGTTSTIDLAFADHSFVGEVTYDRAGTSVSCAGDVDGDGFSDILVGADYNDDGGTYAGKTYLILGASLGATSTVDLSLADHGFVGEASDDWSGGAVSGAGDVDGDGLDDILVGARGNDDVGTSAGKAYLFFSGY